jgi:hypothetical protein
MKQLNTMKRRILAIAIATCSLIGTSCEKTSLEPEQSIAHEITTGRGEIGDETGGACIQPVSAPLLIEKNAQNNWYTDYVGDVHITNTADTIFVNYVCTDGNVLKEVRVWAGPHADAPVNKPGMPEFGHFIYTNTSVGNLTSFTAKIPTSLIGQGNTGVVVAHANTYKHNTESAWGSGVLFVPTTGKAKYITYTACSGGTE